MSTAAVDVTKRLDVCYTDYNFSEFCSLMEESAAVSKAGDFQKAWESKGKILESLNFLRSCQLSEEQKK